MANPVIRFNTSSGNDVTSSGTNASGTNPNGTNASFVGNTVSFNETVDLSGVSDQGDDVLFLITDSGRKFFTINNVDNGNDQVTLDDGPSGTSSGLSWAIGGRRANLDQADNRTLLFTESKTGWVTAELEDDQSLAAGSLLVVGVTGDYSNGPTVFIRSNNTTRRTITQTTDTPVFDTTSSLGTIRFSFLTLINTAGSKGSANGINCGATSGVSVDNCTLGDVAGTNNLKNGILRSAGNPNVSICHTDIVNCTGTGAPTKGGWSFYKCNIRGNGSHGIDTTATSSEQPIVINKCIIADNTNDGIKLRQEPLLTHITHNTIHNNGGDGINLSNVSGAGVNQTGMVIEGNTISGSLVGMRGVTDLATWYISIDRNNFFNNTTDRVNVAAGPNDTAFDPQFTNAGIGDYSVGENAKGTSAPIATLGTNTFDDTGAAQREETAGGGTTVEYRAIISERP